MKLSVRIILAVLCAAMVAVSFWLNRLNGSRFYNPFL